MIVDFVSPQKFVQYSNFPLDGLGTQLLPFFPLLLAFLLKFLEIQGLGFHG